MATTEQEKKVKDNFLTCSICFEMYMDPCTLRCDHTFCRKCVTSYIQTRRDAVQSKTIPCPCCRQDTKVPDPSRPVEEGAGQIKPSIVIKGLIDTYRSEVVVQETLSACCTICQNLGETTPGALWCAECQVAICDKCAKIHRVSPISLNHDLCDLSSRSKAKRRIKCREHKSNRIEFHCQDCGKAACQTCCIIYHRACKTVVTIESMKPGMKAALMEKRLDMEKRLNVRSKKVDISKKKLQSMSSLTESAVQRITMISQTAINKIKQKETQLLDELNNTSQMYASQLRADVEMEEIEMQMYRQHCEFIDQALVSDSEMDLFEAYQAWESGAVEVEDVRDTEAEDIRRIDDIRFTADTDNALDAIDNLQLGEIDVTYKDQRTCLPCPVLVDTMCSIKVDKETHIRSITVLSVDGIQTCVVTDSSNNCLKSFYNGDNYSCHSKLFLDNSPLGMTQLNEKQLMVTVPQSRESITVEVNPDLVQLSTILTSNEYYSLAVLNNSTLAAGGTDYDGYGIVDILDMSGDVLRSITKYDVSLFAYPWHMCVNNKGNILVSDWERESVTCLTPGGDVVWRYLPGGDCALRCPTGITVTSTGDILLVDKHKVIQLTESGEFVRELLTLEEDGEHNVFCDKYGFLFLCLSDRKQENESKLPRFRNNSTTEKAESITTPSECYSDSQCFTKSFQGSGHADVRFQGL
ncbi:E3 ubiquitin-protein ligase TRIM71-like [Haliotis asinina]|uniref:E3 ubiquitin-protein ligase TRIM71-like n=1 Tax=Haliotis asinina TaxID=109174 RepID=UPI00353193E5